MNISPTPTSLPVSTANVATEAVATDTAAQARVPAVAEASSQPASSSSSQDQGAPKGSAEGRPNQPFGRQQSGPANVDNDNNVNNDNKGDDSDVKNDAVEQIVKELEAREKEVKAHEAAHASAGGKLAGSPQLSYVRGPDGVLYAKSGEVSIDMSEVPNDPQGTILKMEQVIRAALAPAQPSGQDQRIAAQAAAIAAQARSELSLSTESTEEGNTSSEKSRQVESPDEDTETPQQTTAEPAPQDVPRLIEQTGAVIENSNNRAIGQQISQSA